MFAAGRGISKIVNVNKPKKKPVKPPRQKVRLTFRQQLYIPCMWSSNIGCCSGIILIIGGLAVSFMGYHAKYFATTFTYKGNHSRFGNETEDYEIHINTSLKGFMDNFMYVGPLLMGFGTLLAIFACVMILETRDRVLDLMEMKKWKSYQGKATFYDLIVLEMKRKYTSRCLSKYANRMVLFGSSSGVSAL